MYKLNRLKKNFDSIILMGVGIISVFLSAPNISKLEGITLFAVGLICVSISVERLFKLENIEKTLNELGDRIASIAPVELIEGNDRIYKAAEEIVKDATTFIRATSFGRKETAPENYYHVVAEKLKESKKQRNPIEYRVIMPAKKEAKRKDEIFDKYGVSDLCKKGYVDITWGLDILIVDNKHLLIAFPELSADESPRKGILFKDNK